MHSEENTDMFRYCLHLKTKLSWSAAACCEPAPAARCSHILTVSGSVSPSVRHGCCCCCCSVLSPDNTKEKWSQSVRTSNSCRGGGWWLSADRHALTRRCGALYRLCHLCHRWVWLAGASVGRRSMRRAVQPSTDATVASLLFSPLLSSPPSLRNMQRFGNRRGSDLSYRRISLWGAQSNHTSILCTRAARAALRCVITGLQDQWGVFSQYPEVDIFFSRLASLHWSQLPSSWWWALWMLHAASWYVHAAALCRAGHSLSAAWSRTLQSNPPTQTQLIHWLVFMCSVSK